MSPTRVAPPRSDRARKRQRQQALLRLVAERRLHTQDELVRALRASGFHATQATVSRDIVELGLVKVARDGAHVYAPPAAASAGGVDRLRRFCEDYPVEVAVAGTLVVLRSLPGTANALAAALDAARIPEVVGTIAGDDTVFLAVARERETRTVVERLAPFGVIQRKGAQP
ncbi:MAG: arginine repressor [Chloroflexota bacterium]|nr:arginine repressor [Chloroflexota bacterium]MDE3194186.1 arginine repressor [Chloroflexota bacterium]